MIVRITPDGTVTKFTTGITPGRFATAITAGPDGALWFVEGSQQGTVGLGRITTDGAITEVPSPVAADNGDTGIATGCDGNLWLTEPLTDRVVRFTPPASKSPGVLPAVCKPAAKTAPTSTKAPTTTTKPKKKKKRK